MLLMKKKFFDPIRRGLKTTTLRLWRTRRVSPGQVHTVPGLGRVRIEAVELVALGELSAADARADGFASLAALRRVLRELYPALRGRRAAGRQLHRVHFRLLNP